MPLHYELRAYSDQEHSDHKTFYVSVDDFRRLAKNVEFGYLDLKVNITYTTKLLASKKHLSKMIILNLRPM